MIFSHFIHYIIYQQKYLITFPNEFFYFYIIYYIHHNKLLMKIVDTHKCQNRISHNNINKTYDVINNRKLEEESNQENSSKKKFMRKQVGINIVKRDSFLTLRDTGNSLSQSNLEKSNYLDIANKQIQHQSFERNLTKTSLVIASTNQKQSLQTSSKQTNQSGFKYLRNLIANPKFDLIPTKKILDHKTRENTPIPRDQKQTNEESQKQSKFSYLQKKLKDSQQKYEQLILLKDKYEELKKEYQAEKYNVSKLIQKLSICMKQKDSKQLEIKKLEQQLKNMKGSFDEKMDLQQINSSNKLPTKLITIMDNKSNIQLEKQNKKLNMDITKLKQQFLMIKQQNSQLRKMNQMYQAKFFESKKQINEESSDTKDKIISSLENYIKELKDQINKYTINQDTQCNTFLLQTTIINLKKQLNYYKIATYCLKKQLVQAKAESNKKISPQEYQDLKTRYKKLIIKHRETKLKTQKKSSNKKIYQRYQSQEEQFQLTPEKETISTHE